MRDSAIADPQLADLKPWTLQVVPVVDTVPADQLLARLEPE